MKKIFTLIAAAFMAAGAWAQDVTETLSPSVCDQLRSDHGTTANSTADTYVRLNNITKQGSVATMEIHSEFTTDEATSEKTYTADFVGLMQFEIPAEAKTSEYEIQSATLRLTTNMCKGATVFNVYSYGNAFDEANADVNAKKTGVKKMIKNGKIVIVKDGKQFENKGSLSSPMEAMQGQVPGVIITRSSAAPGEEGWDMKLRGSVSMNSGGPLVIIDGVAFAYNRDGSSKFLPENRWDFFWGIDVSLVFQGAGNRFIYRGSSTNWTVPYRGLYMNNLNSSIGNTAQVVDGFLINPGAYYAPYTNDSNINNYNYMASTLTAQDGSYLRLKTLTVGYTFPKKILDKLKIINKLRVYFTGADLWEWTKISDGWDPESKIATSGTSLYPFTRNFTFGLNVGF